MHSSPLAHIRLNARYRVIVSADKGGMLEYWTGLPSEFKFPKHVQWEYKTDTDLYEFAKCKTYPTSLAFSPDGKKMATIATDRKVRIFRFLTGKLMRVFDESLTVSSSIGLCIKHSCTKGPLFLISFENVISLCGIHILEVLTLELLEVRLRFTGIVVLCTLCVYFSFY